MSKILNSVLEKVSENNNEYRSYLRTLNGQIDEKTTALVGDVVTKSGYTIDFSNTITVAKEKLVNPISRVIESYVIRDLRSVETVNEQFVEKINDKIESSEITSKEDKDAFSKNLNVLLNEKYLEIVKIKRVNFFDKDGTNADVENAINEFLSDIKAQDFDGSDLINNYKNELYDIISKTLLKISDLYLDNFVNEVSSALNGAIDYDDTPVATTENEQFKPYIPDINPVPEVEIPTIPDTIQETSAKSFGELNIPIIPEVSDVNSNNFDDSVTSEVETSNEFDIPVIPEIPVIESEKEAEAMEVKPIAPIEIKEEKEAPKRSYDVEEILKIAKSPIVAVPEKVDSVKNDSYVNVTPIVNEKEQETMDTEYNEREVVEEMIRRLTKRLEAIDERREKYEEEKVKLEEDEAFVNDLIESSKTKKDELDKFEQELNDKEQELDEKQKELDKKINDVMPFATAVLNTEKES